MPELVTEEFRKSLRSSPTGKRKSGTIFDELSCSLECSDRPLDKAIQTIAEFHGPWTGGSEQLADFTAFTSARLKSNSLKAQANKTAFKALGAQKANFNKVASSVNKQNPETCAIMPTPLLREFVNRVQKMHPAINMYIQMHIGTFPYFQQVSEDIGQFASIVMNSTSIDPLKWPNQNGVECLDTNSRMDKNTRLKMPSEIFNLMDNASNLLNSLFLRAMPKENNCGFLKQNYSSQKPSAHGHNFCMDVFNADRNKKAVAPCTAVILDLSQDTLRLVNKFFNVKETSRYSVEGFNVSMNEGPNGQPITYVVDNSGRPLYDVEKSTQVSDPTNASVVNSKKEYKNEKS